MKSLIVFHSAKSWASKFEVVKTFANEQHENNYIAMMKRKGFTLDEVYNLETK